MTFRITSGFRTYRELTPIRDKFAPIAAAAGAVVVDNTARFRMEGGDIVLGQPTTDQGPVARQLATNGEGVYIVAMKVDHQQQTLGGIESRTRIEI